ncbi:MAG: hypothetical protein N3A71_00210 [Candidatus Dojkabacteria bacterium]|nr:hypothetical protein [Candidatus Dojkabacteria bacterium]
MNRFIFIEGAVQLSKYAWEKFAKNPEARKYAIKNASNGIATMALHIFSVVGNPLIANHLKGPIDTLFPTMLGWIPSGDIYSCVAYIPYSASALLTAVGLYDFWKTEGCQKIVRSLNGTFSSLINHARQTNIGSQVYDAWLGVSGRCYTVLEPVCNFVGNLTNSVIGKIPDRCRISMPLSPNRRLGIGAANALCSLMGHFLR